MHTAHQSLLNSLPGKIAHVYDNASLDSDLKHDIVCRLIAKSIGANSVSILLYRGPGDQLFCAGKYIDPFLSEAKATDKNKYGTTMINLMEVIDIIEYLKIDNPEIQTQNISPAHMKGLYERYNDFEFSNTERLPFDTFAAFIKQYVGNPKVIKKRHAEYAHNIREDNYIISPDAAVTGAYYYALTHSKDFEEFQSLLSEEKVATDQNWIIVAPLDTFPHSHVSSDNLKKKLKVNVRSDAFYIGIPLFTSGRPIGILRLLLNKQIKIDIQASESNSAIETLNYDCENHTEIINYIKKTTNIQGLSYMLSLLVENLFFADGVQAVSLKDTLKGNVNNLKEIAHELTNIINCYGCIIRLSNSNGNNAEIKGYSPEVKDYVTAIKKHKDPYITNEGKDKGKFVPMLTNFFYGSENENSPENKIDIQCLKIDFNNEGHPSLSYLYLNDKSKLVLSSDWKGILNSPNRKQLTKIFSDADGIFKQFDIKSIIQIPIKDWKYGFVTFANTSNRTFLTKDVEMLIPVVNRLSLALKYDSDIAKAENKKKDEIINSQRVIYHQILSPVVSMRNSVKYLNLLLTRELGNQDKKSVIDLRIEEITNTLESTIDLVKLNQFLSGFLINSQKIEPKLEKVSITTFIIEKARTYQPHAKLHRGLDIHVDIVDRKYPRIDTDPSLLAHIIQALIDNAIKYSYSHLKNDYSDNKNPIYAPPDTPNKVNIIVQYFEKEKEYTITVENWGLPIKEEEKLLLTQYLQRGSNAKAFDTNGTGIGLFIVNILAEALNGKVEIDAIDDHTKISVRFKY